MHIWGLQMTCQHFIVKYRDSILGNSTYLNIKPTQEPTLCYGYTVWEYQYIFVKRSLYCQETQQIGFGTLIDFKDCVCYIFASLFLSLNEGTCQIEKNVFRFTSKPLFVLKKIKFQKSTFSNFMISSNAQE